MAEEHRCQAPRVCANNCGFIGSPATQGLCSKCYHALKINQTLTNCSSLSYPLTVGIPLLFPALGVVPPQAETAPFPSVAAVKPNPNRCSTCNRRVGLTGFQCRCRMMFCGSHRYPEQHACSFDFKAMGREQIFKANPVIKAPKLDKI